MNNNYSDIKFNVVDWKNEYVLSSYALQGTPLKFIPNLTDFSYVRVLWDFGDGSVSSSISAQKYYTKPGKYIVNFTLYDCYSNATISTEYKIIHIKDYLTHGFRIDFNNPSYYDNLEWKCGKINGPIILTADYPPHVDVSNLFYRVKDSNSEYYFENIPNKFRHLENTHAFYDKKYNKYTKTHYYEEIDRLEPEITALWGKISNNTLISCLSSDSDAFFIGNRGSKEVYFKDDSVGLDIIDIFFDKSSNQTNNTTKISLSANIVDNDDVSELSITSNGLDGEYWEIESFKIDERKFSNIDIPITFKIKDDEWFSVKNFPLLSTSNFNVTVLSSGSVMPNSSYTLKNVESFKGSARGSIRFSNSDVLHNVQLSASISTTNDQGSAYIVRGVSNYFDIHPKNHLQIQKINEDFDATENFKNLRFQEFLLDKTALFDDFLGSIFGNLSSSYDTLGKKIYEKITNFVDNTQNVDRNEIFSLLSQMTMLGVPNDVFESNLFTYPEKIKRLLDLGSIDKNYLLGFNNKFKENFDIKGYSSKETYGKNLGDQINTDTYVISAGVPIVALEKFSNKYTLLNTEQPLSATNSHTFMLSGYSADWGWPLVLPSTFNYSDLNKYYLFFEYEPGYENTLIGNSIVFDTTIYNNLSTKHVLRTEGGEIITTETNEPIFEEFEYDYVDELLNITLRDTLYSSLSLYHS